MDLKQAFYPQKELPCSPGIIMSFYADLMCFVPNKLGLPLLEFISEFFINNYFEGT